MFKRSKRVIPELNSTSTADISFMLLIFFLVTSSMDGDKGIVRHLPPPSEDQKEERFQEINEKDVLAIRINEKGEYLIDGKVTEAESLGKRLAHFVTAVGKKHLIQIEIDRRANYHSYFALQNEIVATYRSLRNSMAMRKYKAAFEQLDDKQRAEIVKAIPQRISESPVDMEKGGGK